MGRPENNDDNRYELASKILSAWSREDLEAYLITQFVDDYRYSPDIFDDSWDDFKGSYDWSPELKQTITEDN
jgi:hypothetical protein